MNLPHPSSPPLASTLEAARRALAERHGRVQSDPGAESEREAQLLGALREGDDGAYVFRMLLAAHGTAPSPRLFAQRLAQLRAGRTNRYEMLEREASGEAEPAPEPPEFLSRTHFHLAEFEALPLEEFLAAAFAACLKRPPDPFSHAHWLGLLGNERRTRTEVLRALIESDEARLGGIACTIIGINDAGSYDALIDALAGLHRHNQHLEYLVAFLQAQLQGLAARLARLERRG
ncbi:MAG TPA: DUF4214 domain-containing protein [Stellaceae bacterium]|nr:DUF4214 domain-containing protein [Stellaceae bacterium]